MAVIPKTPEKFARVCNKTGKGMNEGFIVNEGDFYFSDEKYLIEWLKNQDFETAEGIKANSLNNQDLKDWAYNDEIYFWTTWDVEDEDEWFDVNGYLFGKCPYQTDKVEAIKKGELIKRNPTAKKLYLRGDYCRETKKYLLTDYDDISRDITVKKGTILYLTWETSNEY